jgi:hypothetical protein
MKPGRSRGWAFCWPGVGGDSSRAAALSGGSLSISQANLPVPRELVPLAIAKLSGQDTLHSLKVTHFPGTEITNTGGGNKFSCVQAID